MSDSETILCTRCRRLPAIHFICYGGKQKSENLCEQCSASSDFELADILEQHKNATCKYCGGSPCAGSPVSESSFITGLPESLWVCLPCSEEYYATLSKAVEGISTDTNQEEQINALKTALELVDSHMLNFVKDRDA